MSDVNISKLLKELKNKSRLHEIGSAVVRNSVKRAILNKVGIEVADVQLVIKKGEVVPLALRNDPNIKMNPQFIAASDHCKAWCKVEDYCKCWGKCTDESYLEPGFYVRNELDQPLSQELVQNVLGTRFTSEEMDLLKELKII